MRIVVQIMGLFAAGLCLVCCTGCGGVQLLDDPNAGRTQQYEAGLPDFDMEAIAAVRGGESGLDVRLGIPHTSLIFTADTDGYEAAFEVLIRIKDERGKDVLEEVDAIHPVHVVDYASTQSYTPFYVIQRLGVSPGVYVVEVTVADSESGRRAVRQQRVEVVGPASRPFLSGIWMRQKRKANNFEPLMALFTPTGMDSLRAGVQLLNAARLGEVVMKMTLLQFDRDTTIARPPQDFSTSRGSLAYQGILRERPDTLHQTRRVLAAPDDAIDLEFDLPALSAGVYRIEVVAQETSATNTATLFRKRDFAIARTDFPRLTSLDQLIEAAAYLATSREHRQMQQATTPAEKKQRFDAFWANLVPNRQAAANLIKRYYSRVEAANLRYSTFKEGWKTDRGMVYILLGEPIYIDRRLDGETWHYSYDEQDAVSTYQFERVRHPSAIFDNYVLERRPGYDATWRRALDRWRNGEGY